LHFSRKSRTNALYESYPIIKVEVLLYRFIYNKLKYEETLHENFSLESGTVGGTGWPISSRSTSFTYNFWMSRQNDVKFETPILRVLFYSCAKIHFLSLLLPKMMCLSIGVMTSEKLTGHFCACKRCNFAKAQTISHTFLQNIIGNAAYRILKTTWKSITHSTSYRFANWRQFSWLNFTCSITI
jgi:hypothetical protein